MTKKGLVFVCLDAGFEVDMTAFDVGVDGFAREWGVLAKPDAASEKLLQLFFHGHSP
ncbi:hypothetical protein [Psychrobacillus sp. OK032]|uniref:hypothetical protein n=1 Tax=Psychrobacillus sp. OK032 TaxID=1884358 RepID=UPI003510AC50